LFNGLQTNFMDKEIRFCTYEPKPPYFWIQILIGVAVIGFWWYVCFFIRLLDWLWDKFFAFVYFLSQIP